MNTKALVAEFIGTFALVFVGIGAIAANAGLTGIALAHGITIAVMVSSVGFISGGQFNPAVTIGALLVKKIDVNNAIGYIIVQCLGAIAAAALIKLAVPEQALLAVGMGTPALGEGITTTQALVAEIILTFFLMFVIYGTAIDKRAPKMGGLFIGLVITANIFMGGPISGAAMNPARHLGPALLGGGLDNIWIYWVGPIIGSSLAALLYHNVIEEN